MTYRLNEKLKDLKPYEIDETIYKIKLDANESFINPGGGLKEKLWAALENISLNRYPDNSYQGLRKAFGDYYGVNPDLAVVGNGSDELLALIIGSFLKSEDTLLLAMPDFSMYPIFASTFERKSKTFNRNKDGIIDADGIIKKIKDENISAALFSNPSSALSTVNRREEILKIVDNTDALIIVDEAYMDFSNQSVLKEAQEKENLIVLRTCSKALGCAGIRLGFAVSSKRLAGLLNALRPPYNLNVLTEAAGKVVLSEKKYIDEAIAKVIDNRARLYGQLKKLEGNPMIAKVYPTSTNYICIETDYGEMICQKLKEESIIIRKLSNMIRITVGTEDENEKLIESIKRIIVQ
jgi:histidinol-phosphate aminotransferase